MKYYYLCLLILLFSVNVAKAESPVVQVFPTFERIAKCESGGNLHAKNPNSSASGEFQFIWSSWVHYGKEYWGEKFYEKNIWSSDNRELAWYVYKKYGTHDWDSSKNCWYN